MKAEIRSAVGKSDQTEGAVKLVEDVGNSVFYSHLVGLTAHAEGYFGNDFVFRLGGEVSFLVEAHLFKFFSFIIKG